MHTYISDLIEVIADGAMDNTYKMAWARALVELCVCEPEKHLFHLDEFAGLIFKYYWNQSIFFNLQQGPSAHRKPTIQSLVLNEIHKYQKLQGHQPKTFIRVADSIQVPTQRISTILTQNVSERFLRLSGKRMIDTYELDLIQRTVWVKNPGLIRDHASLLFPQINYRWAQKLEDFDGSPRIAAKVRGVDQENAPKRGVLKKFKDFLDVENPSRTCFYSARSIAARDLAIDHEIPWSYLFADNLWNLVYVDRRENSAKGNRMPDETTIAKLESRNKQLLQALKQQNNRSKHFAELEIAIERDYLRRFWIGCRG